MTCVSFWLTIDECNDDAKKQSLAWLWTHLSKQGYDTDAIWTGISDIVVKTLIAIQPTLANAYRACKPDQTDKYERPYHTKKKSTGLKKNFF